MVKDIYFFCAVHGTKKYVECAIGCTHCAGFSSPLRVSMKSIDLHKKNIIWSSKNRKMSIIKT
jgi:hypothetical protein